MYMDVFSLAHPFLQRRELVLELLLHKNKKEDIAKVSAKGVIPLSGL